MTKILSAAIVAALVAFPAFAEPVTRTATYDGPKYSGTWTGTRDREARTVTRDTDVFRNSDGVQVYDRTATVNRVGGQVTRSVDTTRAKGFNPRKRFGGRR